MDSILLDLQNPVFTHGHLYLALSRVRDASKVAIFTNKDSLITIGTEQTLSEVFVYPELLSNILLSTDSAYNSYEALNSLMSNISSDCVQEQDKDIF